MSHDYQSRRDRYRKLLQEHGIPYALITHLLNIRYLTGFTGSHAALLISADGANLDRIASDGRYTTQIAQQVPDLQLIVERDAAGALVKTLTSATSIGFEAEHISFAEHQKLTSLTTATLHPLTVTVETLRLTKDSYEKKLLTQAAQIADKALAKLLQANIIKPGATELSIARELERFMFDLGADGVSFETIVATGVNSALPHHRPDTTKVQLHDFVTIDFGAIYNGYHSDCTRTYVVGNPKDWQREIYELVLQAQLAAVKKIRSGVVGKELDEISRSIIAQGGYGPNFTHGLGHGVGLDIHEGPGVNRQSQVALPIHSVVTVEPGVYIAGQGGVRIEDTLIVAEQSAEVITRLDKQLTEL